MLFLADENWPAASIRLLRGNGHDVFGVGGFPHSTSDDDLLALAATSGRIVLTYDSDFGELIFRDRLASPPGIVFFRPRPASPEDPVLKLLALLDSGVRLEGFYTVVTADRIRQRRLT